MYRNEPLRRALLAVLTCGNLALAGCGAEDPQTQERAEQPSPQPVSELRFAGVDLVYALRRVAAEANVLLALDEIQSDPLVPDLARFRVDLDLPAGPLEVALDVLKSRTQAFEYRISDNLLYVRSRMALTTRTAMDIEDLPATQLKADFEGLVRWILQVRPRSYLTPTRVAGEPLFRVVELEVPENSSVLDVLTRYAKAVKRGWRIRRAGQRVTDSQGRAGIVASSLELWPPLRRTNRPPSGRMKTSTLSALASVSERTGTPICIKDRSILGNARGSLDFIMLRDGGRPLEVTLRSLAEPSGGSNLDSYEWERDGELVRITTREYLYYLPGQDLMRDTLKAGDFEGTLAELARWINENRAAPPRKVLMGGEIVRDAPRGRLAIEEGATVEDALTAFARSSGRGWVVVILDARTPQDSAKPLPPNAWRGAYLMSLDVWR